MLIAIFNFSGFYIAVDPDDGSIYYVKTSWWTLKKEHREIRWMKTNEYDYPGWMTKHKETGEWYILFYEY